MPPPFDAEVSLRSSTHYIIYNALFRFGFQVTLRYATSTGPYSDFYDNELFSDITLILCESGLRLNVHRIILAAHSEFFRAALSGSFTESTTTEIPLHFSDSGNVLGEVIKSLYEVIYLLRLCKFLTLLSLGYLMLQ
jgi:hypothetical protein